MGLEKRLNHTTIQGILQDNLGDHLGAHIKYHQLERIRKIITRYYSVTG